ncbi:hypothetical protein N9R34_01410 [Candidatus Thioglobus sp.]|nr:hypothetical protein [Candidatus Thioglobus sp.]MDB4099202.1 hypothetical protein [Candidatus Thioglobus sp.]
MKKLLILLFSILISLNSYGEELNSLFGITLYDNAEKYVSSNYINSNKYRYTETISGYFNLTITDKIKSRSPYASNYLISVNNNNKIHRIYGDQDFINLEICQAVQKDLSSKLEKKYQFDFNYEEVPYPTFKIYTNYHYFISGTRYGIQCKEIYSDSSVILQISIRSKEILKAVREFYDSGM